MQYSIKEARNKLSSVVKRAENGQPQVFKRRDKEVAVLVSIQDWKKLNGKPSRQSLLEVLRLCPVDLSELDLTRPSDPPRDFSFED
ncbi:MAG TPA: type II toxin-antitoxin system Phd/YefM family antitoxin [Pyrinomonadaceae bacterium]|nr:type II toxin-antitoxin system Phd/YefM family antitoxin [Pyrinomonadaceae bacterium]